MRNFIILLTFSILGWVLPAQNYNQFSVTRTSGVSPLAVTFDATSMIEGVSGAPDINSWFYDHEFVWNFGDPGSGNWAYGNQESRNSAKGPIAAHVFETASSQATSNFTVSLSVFGPGVTGPPLVKTQTITVYGSDSVYQNNTVVISNTQNTVTGDWTGEPPGALRRNYSSWSQVRSELFSNSSNPKRVLLRRGETWSVDSTHSFQGTNTNGTLGSFGSGTKPQINVSGGTAVFRTGGANWTIMDLAFTDITVNDSTWLDDISQDPSDDIMMEHLLLLRCETTNFNQTAEHALNHIVPSRYRTGTANGPVYWVDHKSIWTTTDSKKQGQFLLDYERSAMMGCSFQHQMGGEGTTHFNVRFMWARKVVFSNNRIFGNGDRRQSTFRFHALRWDTAAGQTNPNYQNMYTEQVVVSGNQIDTAESGTWIGTVEKVDQRFRLMLIERNHWFSGFNSNWDSLIEINTPNLLPNTDTLHIRRNVFTHDNAGALCLDIRRRRGDNGQPKDTRGVRVYHNTFFTNDSNSGWTPIHFGSDVDDMTVHSNIAHGDNISSITLVDDDSNMADVGDNVIGTDSAANWFVTVPPMIPVHFKLIDGAPAVDSARLGLPKLYQYDMSSLQGLGVLDCGCWEIIPVTH